MIAELAFLAGLQLAPTRGAVLDATTGAPVVAAHVASRGASGWTDARGQFAIAAGVGDTIRVRRIGYREVVAVIGDGTLIVRLTPAAAVLSSMRIRDSAAIARMSVTRSAAELAERGTLTTGAAIAAMPFVAARSARGENVISLRGSRAEQVLVTLDGMPLNDPATGRADVSDLPLSALGAISVTPGTAGSSLGSGASGGVVALSSADGGVASVATTSLGGISADGAAAIEGGRARLRIGAAAGHARNDFEFVNDAGVRDTVERRVNADERKAAGFASGVIGPVQFTALYAARERGMGGAKNVRVYDTAREQSDRRLARIRVGGDRWLAHAGVRRLALHYRDHAPELASDAYGTTVDADVQTVVREFTVRAGIAQEHVWGSTLPEADRRSAFVSSGRRSQARSAVAELNVRVDAVERAGVHVSPSFSAQGDGRVRPFIRLAQGFRLPTFYDLYAPTPMGFVATGVQPEHVLADGELGLRIVRRALAISGSVFARHTSKAVIWFPGNFSWSPKNVSRERVRGAEALLSYTQASISAQGWAAAYDTRLFTDGLALPTPYVPRLAGGASARISVDRVVVAPSITARARRPYAIAPASRQLELPGVFLADLNITYRVPVRGGAALLSAGVMNIGNTSWESVRRFPSPGRTWQAAVTVHP